MRKIEIDKTRF